jgi:hypothetical protein
MRFEVFSGGGKRWGSPSVDLRFAQPPKAPLNFGAWPALRSARPCRPVADNHGPPPGPTPPLPRLPPAPPLGLPLRPRTPSHHRSPHLSSGLPPKPQANHAKRFRLTFCETLLPRAPFFAQFSRRFAAFPRPTIPPQEPLPCKPGPEVVPGAKTNSGWSLR